VDRLIDEFTLLLSPLMHLFKNISSNDVAQHGHYIQYQKGPDMVQCGRDMHTLEA